MQEMNDDDNITQKKGLPDKKCFDLWVSTGAVRKAANHLAAEGT